MFGEVFMTSIVLGEARMDRLGGRLERPLPFGLPLHLALLGLEITKS